MKYLLSLCCLVLVSCSSQPKYKEGTCFEEGLAIFEVKSVEKEYYVIVIHSIISIDRKLKHDAFENMIEKDGLVAISCDKFSK